MTDTTLDRRITAVRRINAPFWLALLTAVVAYVVAFYVLRALLPQPEIAGTLAALTLGGGAYMQRALEARFRQPQSAVVTETGYQRPWFVLLAAGAILIWLAQSIVPYAELKIGPAVVVVSSIETFLRALPVAAAVGAGALIGQRSDRFGLVSTLMAVALGWALSVATLDIVIGFATGSPFPPGGPPGGPPDGSPPDPTSGFLGSGPLATLLSGQLPVLMGVAMLGFWYGTRTRLQAYVGGLLRAVSPDDRQAIVDIAYEEARSTQAASASAQQRVREVASGDPGEGQ